MVVLGEVAVDRGLEVDQRMEHAAPEAAVGQRGKEPLDRVEPRGRGRREVEGPARVPREPCPDLGVLVAGVVVEHDMDQLAGRDVALETVEEANELLVPVALHALPDHRAVEHVHGGEQRRRAVADVVVRHRAGPALLHRQAGLRAVESLDLRLLVDREDDSMGRRVDVKADHIADLAGELRVAD